MAMGICISRVKKPHLQLYIQQWKAAIDKANFHALNRGSDRPGDPAAQVASMVNPAFGSRYKLKPTWSAAKCCFPSPRAI